MPFKVHNDLPVPGRIVNRAIEELTVAIKNLNLGQCLEVDIKDMNWSDREPGFKPERRHILSRITGAIAYIRKSYRNINYTTRPMASTSLGVWRLKDKDA